MLLKITPPFSLANAVFMLGLMMAPAAHAQFGGSRPPLDLAAHSAYDAQLTEEKALIAKIQQRTDEAKTRYLAAKGKPVKYDEPSIGKLLNEWNTAERDLENARKRMAVVRADGIRPFAGPTIEPRFEPRSPQEALADAKTYMTLPPPELSDVKKLRVAASSMGGDLLEHIFPGKFEVSPGKTITGYGQRLEFLSQKFDELEAQLERSSNKSRTLAEFQKKNAAWLDRYSNAVAARQIIFERNAKRLSDRSLKALSEREALDAVKKASKLSIASASSKGAVLSRWGATLGIRSVAALGVLGLVSVAAQAGQSESLTGAADMHLAENFNYRDPSVPRLKGSAGISQ